MGFELIENVTRADIAIHLFGDDLNELFISGGHALISVMVGNPESVIRKIERKVELLNPELDLLLFDFLQEFIFFKDSELLFLIPDSILVDQTGEGFSLKAILRGEPIDNRRHKLLLDVKAVTMYNLNVAKIDERWTASVVLDV